MSIDAVDNKGCTPLIIAAQYGQTMLAGFLMGRGARLQITDKEGDNALHWAAFKGKPPSCCGRHELCNFLWGKSIQSRCLKQPTNRLV